MARAGTRLKRPPQQLTVRLITLPAAGGQTVSLVDGAAVRVKLAA